MALRITTNNQETRQGGSTQLRQLAAGFEQSQSSGV